MLWRMIFIVSTLGVLSPNSREAKTFKTEKTIQEPESVDISGYYSCKGQETGGKSYSGVAVITKKNDVYLVQWLVAGGASTTGIGIRQGNTFSASWAVTNDRGLVRGVNSYRIETGPRLVGRWATLPGGGILQTETLTFLKNVEEED